MIDRDKLKKYKCNVGYEKEALQRRGVLVMLPTNIIKTTMKDFGNEFDLG